jgi:YqjK-like protein
MNDPMFELMQNRSKLLARIAAQREQMTEIEAEWRAPLALADRGVAVVRFLRCHPLLVAGVMAIILIRRRSMAGLMWGVWRAWKGYRDFTSISAKSSSG